MTPARAIEAAHLNARAAGIDVPFSSADAKRLGPADCIVTNPPWGKAVPAAKVTLRARRLVLLTAARPVVERYARPALCSCA
jgi:23S rRNA G2445 N2-methylase RlmL